MSENEKEKTETQTAASDTNTANPNKRTVLVVDDEVDILDLLTKILTRKGFHTIGAKGGKQAFEIIKTSHVDAVLSDVQMPEVSGIELLRLVKNRDPLKPVVILMSGNPAQVIQETSGQNANAILEKPFNQKTLIDTINQCLNNSESTPV